jgi:hypothetical protein
LSSGTFSQTTSPDVAQLALAVASCAAGEDVAASAAAGASAAAQAMAAAPISRRGEEVGRCMVSAFAR